MNITNFVTSWLKDIVSLFIMISIIDLVMPKGNMKRFVDFVVGLLIIFTVINPFIKLVKGNFNWEMEVMKYIDTENISSNKELVIEQEKQVESLYKEKINDEIKNYIEDNSIYNVYDIELEIYQTKENYGEIKSVNIILAKEEEENEDGKDIKVEPIKQVSIGDGSVKESKSNALFDDIRSLISKMLTIESDKITVNMKDKEVKR